MVRIVEYALKPLRSWHGKCNSEMRSCEESLAFYQAEACGASMAVFNDMLERLLGPWSLSDAGLGDVPPGVSRAEMTSDHPVVLEDDACAERLGQITLALLGKRLPSVMWHTSSVPGVFPRLLVQSQRESAIAWLRRRWEAWLALQDRRGEKWRLFRSRSLFNQAYVLKVTPTTSLL